MDISELNRRISEKATISPDELTVLLHSADAGTRQLALVALIRSNIRQAMFHAVDLAKAQGFNEQSTVDIIQRLVPLGDTIIPLIELLKGVGIRSASMGSVEDAMRYLQEAVNKAGSIGQSQDQLSRTAMRFLHDKEIDEALDRLAQFFGPVSKLPAGKEPLQVAILASALLDENAPSIVTIKYAEALRDRGFAVRVVSTEYGNSAGTKMMQRLMDLAIPTYLAAGTASGNSFTSRIQELVDHFASEPVHEVHFLITPMDHVGKVLGSVGIARAQIWDNFAYEPHFGKYDFMCQGVSLEQETNTLWPGRSRYTGSFVAMAKEIDRAEPIDRKAIGIPEDAIMLSTFGRIEKCISHEYMDSMIEILTAAPNAVLVLAGPGSDDHLSILDSAFNAAGLGQRVRYLGRRQSDGPALLKTTDIYCDTYPWPGGQSLFDAMQASLPVVAMRRSHDDALDPSGCGATSSTADGMLGGVVPVAPAGDVKEYIRIALGYINDEGTRKRDGAVLRKRVLELAGFDAKMDRVAALIREAVGTANP